MPVFKEYHTPETGRLKRWILREWKSGHQLCIHRIDAEGSKGENWHDHSRNQWSLVLWGFLTELTHDPDGTRDAKWLFPGRFRRRDARQKHAFLGNGVWTLIVVGPKWRDGDVVRRGSPDGPVMMNADEARVT